MLSSQEILQRVRELEIKSKKLTSHLFTGEYHSAFKGMGMSFKEVKEYTAGDDPRFIDWNVSARMNNTYTKVFEEERELSVYILLDTSASNLFGTHQQNKQSLLVELAAVLAFSATNNNDKAGLLLFSNQVDKYIPTAKGKQHVLYMIREMVTHQPTSKHTNITTALLWLQSVAKHKSIVFILSDFADEGYHQALRATASKHDVIGIQVYDALDAQLPNIGLIQMQDAETGKTVWVDTNNKESRILYHHQFEKVQQEAIHTFKQARASLLQIATGEDYVKILQQFFIKRA